MPWGEAIMASKNAALPRTELALGLRKLQCGAAAGLLVLQLWLDCWRSAMSDEESAAMPAVLLSPLLLAVDRFPSCSPTDSSM